jgi:hypothetical protein
VISPCLALVINSWRKTEIKRLKTSSAGTVILTRRRNDISRNYITCTVLAVKDSGLWIGVVHDTRPMSRARARVSSAI